MTKNKNLIKALTFTLIFALLFYAANRFFSVSDGKGKHYEFMPEETLDVVFCGASSVGTGISPCLIWDEHGISSCNTYTSAQIPLCTYYLLKDVLQYQTPKLVVLDASVLWYDYTVDNTYFEPFMRVAIDSMKLTSVKCEAISDIVSQSETQSAASFYIPFIRFHESWKDPSISNITAPFTMRREILDDEKLGQKLLTGQTQVDQILPVDLCEVPAAPASISDSDVVSSGDAPETIPSQSADYFEKIIDLCNEKGISVLIIKTPTPTWSMLMYNTTSEFAELHDVGYLDYNTAEALSALDLDYQKDFSDSKHLNIYGMRKLTREFGIYLADRYGLEDHRGDSGYDLFDSCSRKYLETLKELEAGSPLPDNESEEPDPFDLSISPLCD